MEDQEPVWDWGLAGVPPEKEPVSKQDERMAKLVEKAERLKTEKSKADKRRDDFEAKLAELDAELAVLPIKRTQLWISKFDGEPGKALRTLLGQKIASVNFVRATSHYAINYSGWYGAIGKPGLFGRDCIGVFVVRMTSKEVLKAKLSWTDPCFVVDDPTGSIWRSIYLGVLTARYHQNIKPREEGVKLLRALVANVVPLRSL